MKNAQINFKILLFSVIVVFLAVFSLRIINEIALFILPLCSHIEVKKAKLIDNNLNACHYLFEGDTQISEYFVKCYHEGDSGLDIPENLRNVRPGNTVLLDRPSYSCDLNGIRRIIFALF